MNTSVQLGCLIMVGFLVGCASPALRRDAARVADLDTTTELKTKIRRGCALTASEIALLQQHGIPEDVLLRNLNASWAVYELTAQDVKQLQAAGVSEAVIDAMLASGKRYGYARASFRYNALRHRHPHHYRRHHYYPSHRRGYHQYRYRHYGHY